MLLGQLKETGHEPAYVPLDASLPLVLTVIIGLLVTGGLLFVLIAPDAVRIHQMLGGK